MPTESRGIALAMVLLLAGTAAACGGGDAPEEVGPAVEAPPADAVSAAPAPALTDPQIAHVAVTANTIDASLGREAEARASSPEVRAFAQMMVTDHTAVNAQATELAGRLGVTPEANAVSGSLESGAEAARARLEGLEGAAFDRAYMDREVEFHQAVLDALDETLIPGTENAELRGLLETVRPAIEAHLVRARQIRASLPSGGQ